MFIIIFSKKFLRQMLGPQCIVLIHSDIRYLSSLSLFLLNITSEVMLTDATTKTGVNQFKKSEKTDSVDQVKEGGDWISL